MLKFSGWSCLISDAGKVDVTKHWQLALHCLYSQWVHIVKCDRCIECDNDESKSLAERRVLSCLAREGYLSHYDLGDEKKRHWNKHAGWITNRRQLRSKIWWLTVLQFALLIALRCVLHRYGNQDIHRWKFSILVIFCFCIRFRFYRFFCFVKEGATPWDPLT